MIILIKRNEMSLSQVRKMLLHAGAIPKRQMSINSVLIIGFKFCKKLDICFRQFPSDWHCLFFATAPPYRRYLVSNPFLSI